MILELPRSTHRNALTVTDPLIRPTVDTISHARYGPSVYYNQPYRDSVALQKLITAAAPTAPVKELASLAKAYATLETLKLRIRMKPAPKPVDTEKQAAAKNRASGRPTMVHD